MGVGDGSAVVETGADVGIGVSLGPAVGVSIGTCVGVMVGVKVARYGGAVNIPTSESIPDLSATSTLPPST